MKLRYLRMKLWLDFNGSLSIVSIARMQCLLFVSDGDELNHLFSGDALVEADIFQIFGKCMRHLSQDYCT